MLNDFGCYKIVNFFLYCNNNNELFSTAYCKAIAVNILGFIFGREINIWGAMEKSQILKF